MMEKFNQDGLIVIILFTIAVISLGLAVSAWIAVGDFNIKLSKLENQTKIQNQTTQNIINFLQNQQLPLDNIIVNNGTIEEKQAFKILSQRK